MKIEHLSTRYGFEAVLVPDGLVDIVDAYSSDLLSDVMANAVEGSVLITIQAHLNTIAVASLVGIRAVLLCNGRIAPEDMKKAAESERIAILCTPKSQFEVSGMLYRDLRDAAETP